MGLTSGLFLTTLGLIALLSAALTVWLWPRLAKPGLRAVAGRTGILITSQLTALLVVAAVLNAALGFYTSWRDLFGVAPQHYRLTDQGRVTAGLDAAQLTVGATTPVSTTKGTLTTVNFVGLRSGITARLRVYLPPQYFSPANSHRHFAAIVVDSNAEPDATQLAADLLNTPQRGPAVIVIVDSADGRPIPCTDDTAGTQAELFWGQDLRSAISAEFRVRLNAASWGAFATGPDQDCALALALRDSGRYSAAAVLGPWRWPAGNAPSNTSSPPSASPPSTPTPSSSSSPSSPSTHPSPLSQQIPANLYPASWLHGYPLPPSRLLFANLGYPESTLIGPVYAPLRITSADNLDQTSALGWLEEVLQSGVQT